MYRIFFEHKNTARFCICQFADQYKQQAIDYAKLLLTYPQNHKTFCEILDDNDNVIWEYNKKNGKKEDKAANKTFSVTFTKEEYDYIMNLIDKHNMNKTDFIVFAVRALENGDVG